MPITKKCPICGLDKPLDDFGTSAGKRASFGRQAYCIPCARLNSQVRWHGMTVDRLREMLAEQDGKCAICQEIMTKPEIDHDHSCCPASKSCGNCTRALLCMSCNRMIGWARDDDSRLIAGAAYLLQHKEVSNSAVDS